MHTVANNSTRAGSRKQKEAWLQSKDRAHDFSRVHPNNKGSIDTSQAPDKRVDFWDLIDDVKHLYPEFNPLKEGLNGVSIEPCTHTHQSTLGHNDPVACTCLAEGV